MLAHLPLFAHPNPKRVGIEIIELNSKFQVLIIGGGDGGILREVLKHDTVEKVTMCEIDEMVIDVAKKFLPGMSCGFSHEKLDLYCGDGFEFLKNHKNEFDVIITDSSDPVGPAESLFGQSYYELLRDALKEDGILSSQGECPWLDLSLITTVIQNCRRLFPHAKYAVGSVPTYTSGLMGYVICANDKTRDVTTPARVLTDDQVKNLNLRFYNSEVHKAAFVLPQFVRNALEEKKE
ncbi:hypothetical protein B9Z55_007489 [Caenorhabditis nigoni]|uniref:PABS domain-containing protein n=1 Tax=Caenorhabditis nigoni TaxID=1611254 RepID=A0A2G5V9V5_9PELO|nr:hypothetical protein B9Z55_007489 [Caenorhabditis nigoni]